MDIWWPLIVKSQDILLLLKIVSLHRALGAKPMAGLNRALPMDWVGWESENEESLPGDEAPPPQVEQFSTRGLESSLGLSKSEVSQAINRCLDVGLVIKDRTSGLPMTNASALLDFIVYGLKYVFPAKPGPMVRGIPTAAAAPVLKGELASAGSYIHVWPDPAGKELGQRIEPIYRSVPHAVRRDPDLYAMLALVDAIRLGKPREVAVARKLLEGLMAI